MLPPAFVGAPPGPDAGIATGCLHWGQRTRLPAKSSPAVIFRPQSQTTSIDIIKNLSQVGLQANGGRGLTPLLLYYQEILSFLMKKRKP